MITLRADDKKRVRIPAAKPRDVYHPETLTRDLIVLRLGGRGKTVGLRHAFASKQEHPKQA